jgi:hypothetical protein
VVLDCEMEVSKDLRPSDLVAAKVVSGSKILKIPVVSENFSWLGRKFQIVSPMFEGNNDGQEFLVIDLIVHFSREELARVEGNRMQTSFIIILAADSSQSIIRSIWLNDTGLGRVIMVEYRARAEGFLEGIECLLGSRGPFELCILLEQGCQWCCNLGVVLHKASVEICKAQKDLDIQG